MCSILVYLPLGLYMCSMLVHMFVNIIVLWFIHVFYLVLPLGL